MLQKNEFFYLGQYAAMSIIQGGCGFPFLSKPVYCYISCGKYTNINVDLDCIPDAVLKFAIEKVVFVSQLIDTLCIYMLYIFLCLDKLDKWR